MAFSFISKNTTSGFHGFTWFKLVMGIVRKIALERSEIFTIELRARLDFFSVERPSDGRYFLIFVIISVHICGACLIVNI